MKHLLTLLLVASSSACFAQGNLQFDRAVYDEFEGLPNSYTSGFSSVMGNIVVGPGKVLKITSVSFVKTLGGPLANGDSNDEAWIGSLAVHRTGAGQFSVCPIWLPEGTYPVSALRSNSAGNRIFSYSGIEFNVVP